MRLLGMILALGALAWLLYDASGGGQADSIIPESYQRSLDQARGVQGVIDEAAQQRSESREQD